MASAVDICNLALSHLGDEATVSSINPPEGSAQAEHCARFYPIARDATLERHAWSFATRRVALAQLTTTVDSWQFAYREPAGLIRPLALLTPDATDDTRSENYLRESDGQGIIYTNVEDAALRYIERVVDTTKYPPLCVTAISVLLGAYLAGPLLKGKAAVQARRALLQEFEATLSLAGASDANGQHASRRLSYRPQWVSDR